MKNLLAVDFMSILPYIIVAVMLIAFVVIVVVAIKMRKKPNTYVPDEVDDKVDEAAHNKEAEISEEAQPVPAADEIDEEEDEDKDEEITFEADDVDEDDTKDDKAEKKDDGAAKRKISYRIMYDKETKTWEIRKDNAKRVIRRVKTKKEALEIAQELSKNQDLNLIVHKKDGKFQKKDSWSRNLSYNDEDK